MSPFLNGSAPVAAKLKATTSFPASSRLRRRRKQINQSVVAHHMNLDPQPCSITTSPSAGIHPAAAALSCSYLQPRRRNRFQGRVNEISGASSLFHANPVGFEGVREVSSDGFSRRGFWNHSAPLDQIPGRYVSKCTFDDTPNASTLPASAAPRTRTAPTKLTQGFRQAFRKVWTAFARWKEGWVNQEGLQKEGASKWAKDSTRDVPCQISRSPGKNCAGNPVEWFLRNHWEHACEGALGFRISLHVYPEGLWELAMTVSNLVGVGIKGSHRPFLYAFQVSFGLVSNCARSQRCDSREKGLGMVL
ncbi:hypothetical protein BKA70DRAFT_1528405 [Coprinopsis sp. MPI-PUGE-AT-0042]|nr:hypothetical protein BKA70DRAFT_1528405 [Coprinopsis sp. MPI-PUGE-AT-0042]